MKKYLWTLDGGRLEYKSTHAHSEINWLFLPGGPGLGSEALAGLTQLLKHKVPGVLWHFDLPGDGSNLLKDKSLADWQSALMQAINVFEKVVLVAHSTPGMYVQTIPDLEKHLHGLVLIGSSPDASWREGFEKYCEEQVDEAIKLAAEQYSEHPTNETLRALLIAGAKYSFSTKESIQKGQDLFRSLAVNHSANFWSSTHFDGEEYKARWVPQTIPTLMMTGSEDKITPIELFKTNQAYARKNILIRAIKGAGHYPWYENPEDTLKLFEEFSFFCRQSLTFYSPYYHVNLTSVMDKNLM